MCRDTSPLGIPLLSEPQPGERNGGRSLVSGINLAPTPIHTRPPRVCSPGRGLAHSGLLAWCRGMGGGQGSAVMGAGGGGGGYCSLQLLLFCLLISGGASAAADREPRREAGGGRFPQASGSGPLRCSPGAPGSQPGHGPLRSGSFSVCSRHRQLNKF